MFNIKVIEKEPASNDLVIVHGAYIGQLMFSNLEDFGNAVYHSGTPKGDEYYGYEAMTINQIKKLPIIEISFNNKKLNSEQLDLFLNRVYANEITVDNNYQLSFNFLINEDVN